SSVHALRACLPDAVCVEMEGAAVAQICYEHDVPFGVLRIVSDRADDAAYVDFNAFLNMVARFYSAGILQRVLARMPEARTSSDSLYWLGVQTLFNEDAYVDKLNVSSRHVAGPGMRCHG